MSNPYENVPKPAEEVEVVAGVMRDLGIVGKNYSPLTIPVKVMDGLYYDESRALILDEQGNEISREALPEDFAEVWQRELPRILSEIIELQSIDREAEQTASD